VIGGIINIIEEPGARGDLSTGIQILKFIEVKLGLDFHFTVLSYLGVVYLLNMLCFKMSCVYFC